MPINVTVTISGEISLQNKNISIYIRSFTTKFPSLPFFSWAVTDRHSIITGHKKNQNWMVKSRLLAVRKRKKLCTLLQLCRKWKGIFVKYEELDTAFMGMTACAIKPVRSLSVSLWILHVLASVLYTSTSWSLAIGLDLSQVLVLVSVSV